MSAAVPPLVYEGPCRMDCPLRCEVPAGARLAVVPTPRHAWSDVAVCPNEGCGIALLVLDGPDAAPDAAT